MKVNSDDNKYINNVFVIITIYFIAMFLCYNLQYVDAPRVITCFTPTTIEEVR